MRPSWLDLLRQALGQRLCRLCLRWASLKSALSLGNVRLSWVWVVFVAGLDGLDHCAPGPPIMPAMQEVRQLTVRVSMRDMVRSLDPHAPLRADFSALPARLGFMAALSRHWTWCLAFPCRPLTVWPTAQEDAEPRQWLLPLMRQHVRGARLAFWATQLLPLARQLGNLAAAAAASDQLLALQCQSWEAQLWDCLPAFADAALDLADAFRWV